MVCGVSFPLKPAFWCLKVLFCRCGELRQHLASAFWVCDSYPKRKALPTLVCAILQPEEEGREGFSSHQSGLEMWL